MFRARINRGPAVSGPQATARDHFGIDRHTDRRPRILIHARFLLNTVHEQVNPPIIPLRRKIWIWLGLGVVLLGAGFLVTLQILIDRAVPIVKNRVVHALSSEYDS